MDHGCLDVFVPQKFLNRSNIVSVFEQMTGAGMSECMAGGMLGDSGLADCCLHGLLQDRIVHMIAALLCSLLVYSLRILRKHPLPTPFCSSIWVLTGWAVL